jgi:hypothetical protein
MLHTPVVLDDGRTVDVAASIGPLHAADGGRFHTTANSSPPRRSAGRPNTVRTA